MTDLPASWALCEIGDVLSPVEMTDKNEPDRDIWYIDISSIDNQTNRVTDPKHLQISEAPSRARQKVKAGDVLFSTVRPYLKKIAAVDVKFDGEIASTGFAVLRGATGIEPKYLFYKAISHDFVSALTGEQYGVSYPAVKEAQVKAQPLELAPTNEQRRIVEKIEAMFDEIDKGVESLQKARTALGVYRQSLLKSAFEGRLTADWRAQNADKLESPETLLARIQKEREDRYKAALDAWQEALAKWREGGEKGKKPAKPSRLVESELAKQSALRINTPKVWAVDALGNLPTENLIGLVRSGQQQTHGDSGYRYVKMDRIDMNGRVDTDTSIRVDCDEFEVERFALRNGDILFNTRNSLELVGKTGIVKRKLDDSTVYNNNLMRIRLTDCTTPSYICYWMISPIFRKILEPIKRATTSVAAVYAKDLWPLPVPICSPAEQAEIVRILDARLEAADALEAEIDAALIRADALRQSILKKAFSGRLVPQDPDDEPASALLERIKAERAKAPKKKKGKISHAS